MDRVIAYVDGFNLYFGLKTKGWRRYYWLNVRELVRNLLKPYQSLVVTRYFTSRVVAPADKQQRQATFLEALETLPDFEIQYGHYLMDKHKCRRCGTPYPEEKMTDVNIAVSLLRDAFENQYDTALLMSADSDLVPAVRTIRDLFPSKRVIAAFPPARHSNDLEKVCHASFTIGRRKIADSLFPREVVKPDGFVLRCPERWLDRDNPAERPTEEQT